MPSSHLPGRDGICETICPSFPLCEGRNLAYSTREGNSSKIVSDAHGLPLSPMSFRAKGAQKWFSGVAKGVLRTPFATPEETGARAAGASMLREDEKPMVVRIKHYLIESNQST